MSVRMPAARNALRVLALLAEQVGPTRAATVARELEIPRSSAYQLLQVMREEGFLVHYPELGAFGPSAKVRQIGSQAGAATRLERLGQPVLERAVSGTAVPATAHLAVLAGSDIVYAARAQGPRSPTTVSKVGVTRAAHRDRQGAPRSAPLLAGAREPADDNRARRKRTLTRGTSLAAAIHRLTRVCDGVRRRGCELRLRRGRRIRRRRLSGRSDRAHLPSGIRRWRIVGSPGHDGTGGRRCPHTSARRRCRNLKPAATHRLGAMCALRFDLRPTRTGMPRRRLPQGRLR